MKKGLKALLGLMTSMVLLAGCGGDTTTKTETETKTEETIVDNTTEETEEDTEILEVEEGVALYDGEGLVLGIMPSLDNIVILVAEEEGLYEKHGANVTIERFYSPKDRDIAYIGKQLNSLVCDLLAVSTYHKSGIETKMISGMSSNFGLVVTEESGVTSLEDLAGKTALYSKNSVIEYSIDKMLEEVGLTENDIEKLEVPAIPLRVEMLNQGEADTAVLPMPYYNQAVLDGNIFITDSASLGIDVVGISVTDEYLEKNEENVIRFLNAYNEAVEFVQSYDKDEFETYAIEALGWSEDLHGNLGEYTFNKAYTISEEQVAEAMEWAFNKSLSDELLSYEQVIYVGN